MMRRLAILLLVCGGLAFFLDREQRRGTFDAWERRCLHRLQEVFGHLRLPSPVVLVELRRHDLPFESWPPAPLDYALIFENLVHRQPREVVVQPLLAWPGMDQLDAATLAERIALLPRGVFACTLQRTGSLMPAGSSGEVPLPRLPASSGPLAAVPEFTDPGQIPMADWRGEKALGFTRIEFGEGVVADETGIRFPMVARRGSELVPSLALQALLAWQNTPPHEVGIQLGRRLVIGSRLELPIDETGRQRVSTRLAPPLRRLDASLLLLDEERDAGLMTERAEELAILRSLEGAMVVLGETGESAPGFQAGSSGEPGWSEGEVVARALWAALSGFHVRELKVRAQWACGAGVVLLGMSLLAAPRRWIAFFAIGGFLALVMAIALVFGFTRWWLPPVPPMALWAVASLVAVILPRAGSADAAAPSANQDGAGPKDHLVVDESTAHRISAPELAQADGPGEVGATLTSAPVDDEDSVLSELDTRLAEDTASELIEDQTRSQTQPVLQGPSSLTESSKSGRPATGAPNAKSSRSRKRRPEAGGAGASGSPESSGAKPMDNDTRESRNS